MDLYHLEYIVEIGKTGNISKAAENLHISQPTLSIYLNKLERSLAVPLFIRKKNLLVPTEAGEKYVDACRRILSIRDVEKLQKLLKIAARADSIEAFKEMSEQL